MTDGLQPAAQVKPGTAVSPSATPVELPPGKENEAAAKEEFAKLTGVPMGDLARKFSVGELASFLRDPVKSRPGGRMPAMKPPHLL